MGKGQWAMGSVCRLQYYDYCTGEKKKKVWSDGRKNGDAGLDNRIGCPGGLQSAKQVSTHMEFKMRRSCILVIGLGS